MLIRLFGTRGFGTLDTLLKDGMCFHNSANANIAAAAAKCNHRVTQTQRSCSCMKNFFHLTVIYTSFKIFAKIQYKVQFTFNFNDIISYCAMHY